MHQRQNQEREILTHTLVLDSGANILIFNNPNFYLELLCVLVNTSTPQVQGLYVIRLDISTELSSLFLFLCLVLLSTEWYP